MCSVKQVSRFTPLKSLKHFVTFSALALFSAQLTLQSQVAHAAIPGLPFNEYFAAPDTDIFWNDADLKNPDGLTANWSTKEEKLLLKFKKSQKLGLQSSSVIASDISTAAADTYSIVLADFNGDTYLDVITGDGPTLYLNNKTSTPYKNVVGQVIASGATSADALAYGDINKDGSLDLVVGNAGQGIKVMLNDGTDTPFASISSIVVSNDQDEIKAIQVVDINNDGLLDVVTGNRNVTNKYYLNTGASTLFEGITSGIPISSDMADTWDIELADIDNDGDIDAIATDIDVPNIGKKARYYLNNGTSVPFDATTTGYDVGAFTRINQVAIGDINNDGFVDLATSTGATLYYCINMQTATPFQQADFCTQVTVNKYIRDMYLADTDNDGDLDIIVATDGRNGIFLNEGPDDPFPNSYPIDISDDALQTFSMALGDIDKDGDIDVVSGNLGLNRVYLNGASLKPFSNSIALDVSNTLNTTSALALGDLDNDGDLDIVEATSSGYSCLIYFNNGSDDPFADLPIYLNACPYKNSDLHIVDLNGDGLNDIAVANSATTTDTSIIIYNDGASPAFSTKTSNDPANYTSLGPVTNQNYTLAIGDINNDGHPDIITGNYATNIPALIFLNDGSATPFEGLAGTEFGSISKTLSSRLVDLNNDGYLDYIEGNENDFNRVYLHNKTSTPYTTSTTFGAGAFTTNDLAIIDINKDGLLDIVTGNSNSFNYLYINDGVGDPFDTNAGIPFSTDNFSTTRLNVADYNRDGLDDIAASHSDGRRIRLYQNSHGADYSTIVGSDISSSSVNSSSLLSADFDQDGDIDVLGGINGDTNLLYLNDASTESFSAPKATHFINGSAYTRRILAVDIDNDGDKDIVSANNGVNYLSPSDGSSEPFQDMMVADQPISNDSYTTYEIAAGDLNKDGLVDLVAANSSASNTYYLNDGDSSPFDSVSSGTTFGAGATQARSVKLADINKDGNLDIIVGNYSSSIPNQIYFHNGNNAAPFSGVTATPIDNDLHNTTSIEVVDIDHDGDLDIIAGNDSQANRVYINDGAATFGTTSGSNITNDSHTTFAIATGDVDGDGDIDVIAGNIDDYGFVDRDRLYLNDGVGAPFDTTTGSNLANSITYDVTLVDIDHDGDLDIFTNTDAGNYLQLNNGTSSPFSTTVPEILNTGYSFGSRSSDAADVDGDGNPDIIVGMTGTNLVIRSKPYIANTAYASSLKVNGDFYTDILKATLVWQDGNYLTNSSANIKWYLSNNGGERFYQVEPGVEFTFPTPGDDLRWKAELDSKSPIHTPIVDSLNITARFDQDHDLVTDDIDICPTVPDPDQLDNDTNNLGHPFDGGDACDDDDDNDTFLDTEDLFPFNPNESHDFDGDCAIWVGEEDTYDYNLPTSGDGCGDFSDLDMDGDGISNVDEAAAKTNIGNAAPTITGSPGTVATPGVAYTFTPVISDGGDGPGKGGTGSLSVSVTANGGLPAWLTFDPATGVLTGVPSNDDYGTISNIVLTVSDGTEQANLPSFNINVTDKRAPTTIATMPTGKYNSNITAALICSDGSPSSGCASIRYTTDDAVTDPANFTVFNGSYTTIDIPASSGVTTLRYYSIDNAATPNVESVQSRTYTFDTDLPTVSITSPASGSVLITASSIDGSSSDTGTGVQKVELQITDGTNHLRDNGAGGLSLNSNGAAEWVTVATTDGNWSFDTSSLNWSTDTVYTLIARATDSAGNQQATSHSFTHYGTGDASPTSLALSLTNTSIPSGEKTDATLTLTRLSDPSFDLSGVPLELHITKPDASTVVLNGTAGFNGQYTFDQLGAGGANNLVFTDAGVYRMVAKFTDTATYPNLAAIDSSQVNLLVATSAGYAVIVQGKLPNNDGLASHNKTANRIYETLKDRGFADEDIFYFNYNTNQTGVDGLPDKATIQKLLEGSANTGGDPQLLQDQIPEGLAAAVADRPAPIYTIFVDHGGKATESLSARFFIDQDIITPVELNSWLGSLESNLDAIDVAQGTTPAENWLTAKNPRIVIIGACYSGGFINDLSDNGRVIMTSATENEQSYKGPKEDDNIRVGEYFLEELFLELGAGNDLRGAFKLATAKTETYTKEASGDVSTNTDNEFLDTAVQHPLLDDDGDTVGTNTLFENTADGQLAVTLKLGFDQESLTNDAFIPADIVSITPTLYLANTVNSANIELYANDPFQVNQAYVEIRSPATILSSAVESTTEQLTSDFVRRAFTPPATEGAPYTLSYDGFDQPGKYELFYYVNDRFTGALSSAKRGVVYKNRPDDGDINDAPYWSGDDLLSPAHGATGNTMAGFNWEDAIDPDGDAVTYNFILADNTNFNSFTQANEDGSCTTLVNTTYRQEELTSSSTYVDTSSKLCDLSSYVWKVEAVDAYGLVTATIGEFSYNTNNTNSVAMIVALVRSAATHNQLTAANIINNYDEGASVSTYYEGKLVILTTHTGVVQTITASNGGYNTINVDQRVDSGATVELLFDMQPASVDTDGDGIDDGDDNCPTDDNGPAEAAIPGVGNQTDTDADGIGDACDPDGDNDGMPNTYEDGYAFLDPFDASDAGLDQDSDSISNVQEYRDGTAPDDPLSPEPDTDKDGIGDITDNCLTIDNGPAEAAIAGIGNQTDSDGDLAGDACDDDDDNDGMPDDFEIFYGLNPINSSDATGNADADAYTNLEESLYGTDPNVTTFDTDGDGLPDAFEASIGTSHVNADTDGDNLSDYAEVGYDGNPYQYTAGVDTNPNASDTDADTFQDDEELLFGTDPLVTTLDTDSDGLPDDFETAIGTSPVNADTDGDNLSDYAEVGYDGNPYQYTAGVDTNPNASDTDADTFQDDEELLFGTDPLVTTLDTDSDGLPDDFETAIGTSAVNADTDGDNLSDYAEIGYDGDPYQYTAGADTNPNDIDTDADTLQDDVDPDPLVFTIAVPGDVAPNPSPDGVVNVADLLIMQRIILDEITPTSEQLQNGDLYPVGSPDGLINTQDLILLRQMVLQ
ncbi:FG-GAP-like repeat-containing protein [Pseudomonadota bacterium]